MRLYSKNETTVTVSDDGSAQTRIGGRTYDHTLPKFFTFASETSTDGTETYLAWDTTDLDSLLRQRGYSVFSVASEE